VHSVNASDSTENLSVPSHFQALFDSTLDTINLSLSNKQKLASVLQRNSCAFATNSLDLSFCSALQVTPSQ